jgi:UDP-N-acetyl-2-amino-2-deoxyglucuronate dehydrogenase
VTGHPHASDLPRFAIVGAGVIGAYHAVVAGQLADHMELAAIVDVHVERAEKLTDAHGGSAFGSLTEALGQVAIDVVVVCTPTGRHREVAIEALEAGKDVIVEKPAETTVERTDAIIEAQRRTGRLVTVISQHRFDPSTEVVLAAINAGELGRLTSGIAAIDWWRGQSYYDSADWRGTWALDGGGALMNQGVHTVDLLVAAFGQPVEVFAYTDALAHQRIEVEDVAVGVVRFESGALAVLHATTSAFPGLSARLHVHGDRGSAVVENDSLAFLHKAPTGTDPQAKLMGSAGDAPNQADQYPEATKNTTAAGSDPGQLSDAHRLQYLNFLAALRGEEELRVTLETNRRSIGVIEGVYTSARTGRPVTLSRDL